MNQVSTLRRNLLRVCYLVMALGITIVFVPELLNNALALPLQRGIVVSMLSAMAPLAIVGIFSPVRMLPLLVFEITWKMFWMAAVALPAWQTNAIDDRIASNLFACALVIPFVFIVPWRYLFKEYLSGMEPWR